MSKPGIEELSDRQQLAKAIRRVARARGRAETHVALVCLIGVAEAWATRLAEVGEDLAHRERAASRAAEKAAEVTRG